MPKREGTSAVTVRQLSLFGAGLDPWDEDDRRLRPVAQVVFSEAPFGPYDYEVPEPMRGDLAAGMRVKVPLGRGNQRRVGYCVDVGSPASTSRNLKLILSVMDDHVLLSPLMLKLARWLAEYYLCPLGQVLETLVPSGVRTQAGTRVRSFLTVSDSTIRQKKDIDLPTKQRVALELLADRDAPMTPVELARPLVVAWRQFKV